MSNWNSDCLYSFTTVKPIYEGIGGVIPLYTVPLRFDGECYMSIMYVPAGLRLGDVQDDFRQYHVLSYQWLNCCDYEGVLPANG